MPTVTSPVAGVDFTAAGSTALFAVGTPVEGTDGTGWVYIKSTAAITAYHAVAIDEDYNAVSLTKALADVGHSVGFAQVAMTSNEYGWVARYGSNISVILAQDCLPDVALYTTSTAGVVDDTSASQTKLLGVVAVATGSSSGTKVVEILATSPVRATLAD